MLDMVLDRHDDGLIHLVADDMPDACFSEVSFFHRLCLLNVRHLGDDSLDSGDVPADVFDSARVVKLVCRVLEAEVEQFLLRGDKLLVKLRLGLASQVL